MDWILTILPEAFTHHSPARYPGSLPRLHPHRHRQQIRKPWSPLHTTGLQRSSSPGWFGQQEWPGIAGHDAASAGVDSRCSTLETVNVKLSIKQMAQNIKSTHPPVLARANTAKDFTALDEDFTSIILWVSLLSKPSLETSRLLWCLTLSYSGRHRVLAHPRATYSWYSPHSWRNTGVRVPAAAFIFKFCNQLERILVYKAWLRLMKMTEGEKVRGRVRGRPHLEVTGKITVCATWAPVSTVRFKADR